MMVQFNKVINRAVLIKKIIKLINNFNKSCKQIKIVLKVSCGLIEKKNNRSLPSLLWPI